MSCFQLIIIKQKKMYMKQIAWHVNRKSSFNNFK